MCPVTCGTCDPCYENPKSKFAFKKKLMTCKKLLKQSEEYRKNVCQKTRKFNGYQPASIECPKTCSIISNECKPPTEAPVIQPTRAPITLPTSDPASPPTTSCIDDAKGFFLIKVNKKGKDKLSYGKVRSCEWLADREDKDDICSKYNAYHQGLAYEGGTDWENTDLPEGIYGPPHTMCQDTCNSCYCYEKRNSKWFKELKNDNLDLAVLKDCDYLTRRDEDDQKKQCEKTGTWKGYPPASVACPRTCAIVNSECDL